MIRKPYTIADYLQAIQIKEREIQALRESLAILQQGDSILDRTLSGNGGTEPRPSIPDSSIERRIPKSRGTLSPWHAQVLNIIRENEPVLAPTIAEKVDERFFDVDERNDKGKRRKVSQWLFQLKGKKYVMPDPNNTNDRQQFRWILTQQGKEQIQREQTE
jgi:hypothetical protein